eukprot:GHVL01030477.1.p1 GENE.GHVL01030477.1~~GHVL01030477.1.p1  ORF type:complete len:315 (-),score=58.39 GHVL01030477.1:79-987(-)
MLLNTDEMKAALNDFNESSEPEAKRVREVIFQMKENIIPSLPAFVLALEHVKEVQPDAQWLIELSRDAAIQHDQNMGPFQKRLEEERILEDISLEAFYDTMKPRALNFFDQYPPKYARQRHPLEYYIIETNWESSMLPILENLDTTIDYLWTDFLALRGLKRKVAKSLTEPEKNFVEDNYLLFDAPKMPIMDFIDEASVKTCSLLKTLEIYKSAIVGDDLRNLQYEWLSSTNETCNTDKLEVMSNERKLVETSEEYFEKIWDYVDHLKRKKIVERFNKILKNLKENEFDAVFEIINIIKFRI